LNQFGTTLADFMREFKQKVQDARRKLEGLTLEESDDVTLFVTEIQEMNRVVKQWETQLDRCKRGEKLLHQQRFQWPANWPFVDLIDGEWASFRQILGKRSATMQDQIPAL
jgi:dynein heavy chain 1